MLSASWRKYNPEDFLLCYESVNSVSTTQSYVLDDYFAFLDDEEGASPLRDMPDVGVGRLPVRGTEQARQMVDKTLDYIYNKNAGAWKNVLCFLADDDTDTRHPEDTEKIIKTVEEDHDEFLIKKFYWDAYKRETTASGNSYPDAHKEIMEQLKNGALVVNYVGHGNEESLSHEGVLKIGDIQGLSSPRLPVWLLLGCDIGPFDNATGSLGEEMMLNPKGGGIGVLSSARTTFSGSGNNEAVGKYFLKYGLGKKENGQPRRLGDAMKDSRVHMISNGGFSDSNRLCYVLLGDPAVSLTPNEYTAVVESFNGISDEQTMIKAGGKVTVNGKIVNAAGELAEDFTGLVYPTVSDNLESLATRDNGGGGKFYYKARTKTLFAGSDSVRAGKFNFTFPVPLDINYSDESGLMNLYAIDNSKEKEALGVFSDFLVGGTEDGA